MKVAELKPQGGARGTRRGQDGQQGVAATPAACGHCARASRRRGRVERERTPKRKFSRACGAQTFKVIFYRLRESPSRIQLDTFTLLSPKGQTFTQPPLYALRVPPPWCVHPARGHDDSTTEHAPPRPMHADAPRAGAWCRCCWRAESNLVKLLYNGNRNTSSTNTAGCW